MRHTRKITTVLAILKERFGHAALYPLQERIIERVMGGGDALVVMPTGSGKSLCYQLPALALPGGGVTLVFSPLIALMEDQVAALKRKGIGAEYINSTLDRAERERRYAKLGAGAYELIYATPERMYKPEFVDALAAVPGGVKLLAVDEAHCITKWGHDFRPAYQEVGQFRRQLGSPITIALTATATPHVREDIRRTLEADEESMPLFASGIDRPNLALLVEPVLDDDQKRAHILRIADERPGTGIVYFALIKHLEEFAAALRRDVKSDAVANAQDHRRGRRCHIHSEEARAGSGQDSQSEDAPVGNRCHRELGSKPVGNRRHSELEAEPVGNRCHRELGSKPVGNRCHSQSEDSPVGNRCHELQFEIYHGQLDPREKKRVYRRFIDSRPDERLMLLATNAFGMGVDKPDIRFIVHAQVPGSVEAYYQEIGRAGRDGEPSECVLLYGQDDLAIQHQFVEWMNPSAAMLHEASIALERSDHATFDVDELRDMIIHKNRGDRRAEYVLIALEKLGVVEEASRAGQYRFVRPLREDEVDGEELERKKRADLQRLLDMVNLTKAEDQRRFILDYFALDET